VHANDFSRLLLLLPGETHLPGDKATKTCHSPGKSGEPSVQSLLEPFPVTVYACDRCWNRVTGPGSTITLDSDFSFDFTPQEGVALEDSAVFSVKFNASGPNQNVWAVNQANGNTSYRSQVDIRPLATQIQVWAPDTVLAGRTAWIYTLLSDANSEPITAAVCRFAVVGGSGIMLDTALLTDTLGRATARFVCSADRGAETDTIKIVADTTEYIEIYVERPDDDTIAAFPNPFGFNQESGEIHYYLQRSGNTSVIIYDPFGNEVKSWGPFSENQEGGRSGINRLWWDGRNNQGRRVANGMYIIQVLSTLHTGTNFKATYRIGVVR